MTEKNAANALFLARVLAAYSKLSGGIFLPLTPQTVMVVDADERTRKSENLAKCGEYARVDDTQGRDNESHKEQKHSHCHQDDGKGDLIMRPHGLPNV